MALVFTASAILWPTNSDAGILSKIFREAGEAGSKAAKHGSGSLDNAAAVLRKLPDGDGAGPALAVHATPEGHWTFVNKKGEQFTAGTKDELARAPKTLLNEQAAGQPLTLYLTDDTIFEHAARIKDLPVNAKLKLVVKKDSYRLVSSVNSPTGYVAQVRPNLRVELASQDKLHEALYRLARPIKRANIRVLALEPGGPKRLSSVPSSDPATRARLIETVDPADLATAMAPLKGQTVVVTGEVKAGVLHYQPGGAPAGQKSLAELAEAARRSDVNLVVLRSSSPTQPGAKTWLWRTVEVDGLDTALKRPTFADFLQSVSTESGDMLVSVREGGRGRLVLTANPTGGTSPAVGENISGWLESITTHVTGSVVTNGITAFTRDEDREREFSMRLLPGIPSSIQIGYALSLVAGLIGLGVAREWWRKLWPAERRAEYAGAVGFHAARCARLLAFVLLFLPLVGGPALVWSFVRPAVLLVMWPFRIIGGLLGRMRS